jgi:hypothetical protein
MLLSDAHLLAAFMPAVHLVPAAHLTHTTKRQSCVLAATEHVCGDSCSKQHRIAVWCTGLYYRCWVCQHSRHGQGTLTCLTGSTSSQHLDSHCSKCSSRWAQHGAGAVLANWAACAEFAPLLDMFQEQTASCCYSRLIAGCDSIGWQHNKVREAFACAHHVTRQP